ncbi:MAG: dephospho-CoA kinase [Planctomycetota bacterium]|jgi:dephospho-CoA kinase
MDKSGKKPVIGIVGGIGSGKSTAAGQFAALGCKVIDADAIGREVIKAPGVKAELRRRWGGGIFTGDGSVDRSAVARIVFADRAELEALNSIMHPRMRRRMDREVAAARSDAAVKGVVIDAAVLFEAGWDELCTHVIFVDAAREVRMRRLSAKGGADAGGLAAREKFQISLDKKRRMCDYKIENSSTVSHLREQVGELFLRICHPTD